MNNSITTVAAAGSVLTKAAAHGQFSFIAEQLKKIKDTVFYFGLNYSKAWQNFKSYFLKMFPLIFWPAALGLILFFSRVWKWKKKYWAYLFAYFTASIILVLYYGSWIFNDNPNLNEITIGNSYTRYWLPVYLGAMPFAAFFISRLSWAIFSRENENSEVAVNVETNIFKKFFALKMPPRNFCIAAAQAIIIIFIFFFSANFLIDGSDEGLLYNDFNNQILRSEYSQVLSLTEPSAVIITRYHDKIFFPERKVIVGDLTDETMNFRYAKLVKLMPVYYYNFSFQQKDIDYLNAGKLKNAGLNLKKIKQTDSVFTLYKLENYSPASSSPKIIQKSLTSIIKYDKNKKRK
jgi:hypothetical protein